MKFKILLLSGISVSLVSAAAAQPKQQTAYAITSSTKGAYVWTEVKLIDINTGEVVRSVFDNDGNNLQAFNARNGKAIRVKDAQGNITDQNNLPFSTFSAACAYDKKHNRLYYTPMFINQLRYIDLDGPSPKIYYFESEALSTATNLNDEANHITRMTIGADGRGYGLSNDGNHLVRFTTGRKPVIADLGALEDDPANGPVSIHTKETSWGGDMIADMSGNLYLISAQRAVFKVDIQSRKAKYISTISGLPADYTTNGAVVRDDNKLVVSSAQSINGYYEVDMNGWAAKKIGNPASVFNTSDLANGNLLKTDEAQATEMLSMERLIERNKSISVYPNPVTQGSFRVSFNNPLEGKHDILLIDISGSIVAQKAVTVSRKSQVEEIPVRAGLASGVYLVKVLNNSKKTVYADRLVISN